MNYTIGAFGRNYTFNAIGAELISAKDIATQYEFIWQADKNVWSRHAPILFPIVGKLKNNQYLYQGTQYTLNQHGFARDLEFEIHELYTDLVTFKLENNAITAPNYPFQFCLLITYQAIETGLFMHLQIHNTGTQKIPFSIGLHPGFNLPETELVSFELYSEKAINWQVEALESGLCNGESRLLASDCNFLALNSESFKSDALVFKNFNSKFIGLRHQFSNFKIEMQTTDFPYLGVWNKFPSQSYVCLEPWAGVADSIDSNGDIFSKEGIQILDADKVKSFTTSIQLTAP